ncbi:hypothetical protein AOLI_G00254070 [Acnodon oligacanthus]
MGHINACSGPATWSSMSAIVAGKRRNQLPHGGLNKNGCIINVMFTCTNYTEKPISTASPRFFPPSHRRILVPDGFAAFIAVMSNRASPLVAKLTNSSEASRYLLRGNRNEYCFVQGNEQEKSRRWGEAPFVLSDM